MNKLFVAVVLVALVASLSGPVTAKKGNDIIVLGGGGGGMPSIISSSKKGGSMIFLGRRRRSVDAAQAQAVQAEAAPEVPPMFTIYRLANTDQQ